MSVDEIRALIARHPTAIVVCHEAPDGDAVGSVMGLTLALRQWGTIVFPVVPKPYLDAMWDWVPGWGDVNGPQTTPAPQLVFVVDAGSLERPARAVDFKPDTVIVNIDHHVSNAGFGRVNVIDLDAAATCEILYSLLVELGAEITPDIATCLYAGIFSDTGGFRHENTTARSLDFCAALVRDGADPAFVARKLYRSRPLRSLKLQAAVMSGLRIEPDGIVWAPVTQAMLAEASAYMADSEGVIDVLNTVEGISAAILFKETAPGRIKVSLRSRDSIDADRVCGAFGGGGHPRAAGCDIPRPLAEAVPLLLEELRRVMRREESA